MELAPGKDGLVKIKDLEFKRTEKVEDVLHVGDMTWVKVMNIGPRGIDLSRKDALKDRGGKRGIATLCLGGGNGVALAVELV